MLPTLEDIQSAARIVYADLPPTPQYRWPMLCERVGAGVWVKHENHTPVGAFKIRGGLVYFDHLARNGLAAGGVITATRGNHGQSVAYGARRAGLRAVVVVPHGNSTEKNAAMRALGAELIVHGDDFQASREYAEDLARERSLHFVPSFHPLLIAGVATYGMELLQAAPGLDVVYVPIGLGSGICGVMAARDALGLETRVVGVVSAHANAYAQSFSLKRPVDSPVTTLLSDGMACRKPEPDALDQILAGVDRIVEVTDDEVAAAVRMMFECTHNVCEGAGAAALAAAVKDGPRIENQEIAVVASGGNIDRDVFAGILGHGDRK